MINKNTFYTGILSVLLLCACGATQLSAGEVDITFETVVSLDPQVTITGQSTATASFNPVFNVNDRYIVGIDQIIPAISFESFGIFNTQIGAAPLRQVQTGNASFELAIVSFGEVIDPNTFDGTSGFNGIGTPLGIDPNSPFPDVFNGTGTEYLAFQYVGTESPGDLGNVGYIQVDFVAGGNVTFAGGRYNTVGGAVTVGTNVVCADFDQDGNIDGFDFLIWQSGVGNGTTFGEGDANGDAMVNGLDLAVWETQYGTQGPAGPLSSISAVPEPCGFSLVLGGLLCGLTIKRGRT